MRNASPSLLGDLSTDMSGPRRPRPGPCFSSPAPLAKRLADAREAPSLELQALCRSPEETERTSRSGSILDTIEFIPIDSIHHPSALHVAKRNSQQQRLFKGEKYEVSTFSPSLFPVQENAQRATNAWYRDPKNSGNNEEINVLAKNGHEKN